MNKPAKPSNMTTADTSKPAVDYESWLAAEIDAGCAELDAGEGLPAEKVWQELGLE